MANSQMSNLTRQLRQVVLGGNGAGLTDGQLLGCFVENREEAAFTALLHRHGPMVWNVCRRILRSHQDVEDAFQATFLVLLRKAHSIKPREMVASWLYGVAHQTAKDARAAAARRRAREKQVTDMPEPAMQEKDLWHDLQPLLDQELSRLPQQYRILIVLCDLEGKTRKKVAEQLKCPEGTVAGRLARARGMLAKRLARHGLAISGVTLATVLSDQAVSACVPISVMASTKQAVALVVAGQAATGAVSTKVAALTEGVLKTMLLTKLKIATAVLVSVGVLGTGIGFALHPAQAGGQTGRQLQPLLAEPPAKAPPVTLKVQVNLEGMTASSKGLLVTGTFLKTHSVGAAGDPANPITLVRSKLVDIPVSQTAKIMTKPGTKWTLVDIPGSKTAKIMIKPVGQDTFVPSLATLELAVEEGGLVVVGIQIVEKQDHKGLQKQSIEDIRKALSGTQDAKVQAQVAKSLEGTWKLVSVSKGRKAPIRGNDSFSPPQLADQRQYQNAELMIKEDEWTEKSAANPKGRTMKFSTDSNKSPSTLDLVYTQDGKTFTRRELFILDGKTLKIVRSLGGSHIRPKGFDDEFTMETVWQHVEE